MKGQLFIIYHSFLLKKWYLIVYILMLIAAVLATLIIFSNSQTTDESFSIGLVDQDKSRETQLILKAIGDGQSMGKDIELKQFEAPKAKSELKLHHLDGYFVFDKGMTDAFYKQGELPISVYTYDKSSVESVIIYQLTDSVYSRLMRSMGGAKAYKALYPEADNEAMMQMMTDMLITGLDRGGAFDDTPVKLYEPSQYYSISACFIFIYIFFLSLFSILKMNQEDSLKLRLSMFHFSAERLTLIRGIISYIYTLILSILILWLLISTLKVDFEMYNIWPLIKLVVSYTTFIFVSVVLIELLPGISKGIFKVMLTLLIVLCSGATLPSVYLKHALFGVLNNQPFSYLFNSMIELILNNYIIKVPTQFYPSFLCVVTVLIGLLIWRYRR